MMDPRPQSTSDKIRKSSGKLLDAELRPENRLADVELADVPRKRPDRDQLLATIEELRLTEERIKYRELFDFAPEAYLTTDLFGTIRDANIAAGRLLGVEPQYLVGKALHSFFE